MYLRTLGNLALEGIDFRRPKPLLLLAFLALEGPKSRREVAELFWLDAKDARDSLSGAIRRLNANAERVVEPNGDRLEARVACDALAFKKAMLVQQHRYALEHYTGAFLDGLDLPLAEEIEEWVFATRERLAGLARHAHLQLAHSAMARRNLAATARHAEEALDVRHAAPLDPAGLEELLWLLHAGHSPRARELEHEAEQLGVPAVLARTGPSPRAAHLTNLPRYGTSFVGRSEEVARVQERLSGGRASLLTLHGPGGVGKSRLAVEAARELFEAGAFPDGAFFVPLEDVPDPAGVPVAIADALQVPLVPQVPEEAQILNLIADQRLLVVLDNFEHLAARSSLPAAIARACPNARVLVTSRQLLHHQDEHVLPVAGLPVGMGRDEGDAARLLRDRLAQGGATADRTPEGEAAVRQICELVAGLPLAIELAAAWGRAMSLPDIAAELRENLDLLVSRDRGTQDRHHSQRATFEISWSLLVPAERASLRRLAVFRGGFRRDAAQAVARTDLATLSRLVDKSLLRVTADGRFERHPLIHQYTLEKLEEEPAEADDVRTRHARYFLEKAKVMGDAGMGGPDVLSAWEWFTEELANVTAAWEFAATQPERHQEDLTDVAWYVCHYGEQQARYRDVQNFLRLLPPAANAQVRAEVLAFSTWFSWRLGEIEAAERDSKLSLELLTVYDPVVAFRGLWSAYEGAMGVCLTRGDFPQALENAHAAIAAAKCAITGFPSHAVLKDAEIALGFTLNAVATIHVLLGAFEEAEGYLTASHDLLKKHRSGGLGFPLHLRGQLDLYTGDSVSAVSSLDAALDHARRVGFQTQEAQILCDLAQARLALNDLTAAETDCRNGLAIATRNGNGWHETMLRATLGRILLKAGRIDEALAAFREAAERGLAAGAAAFAAEALVGLAEHHAERGERKRAAELLASVRLEPTVPAAARILAGSVAEDWGLQDPPAAPEPMVAWLEKLAAHGPLVNPHRARGLS